jgi:hypothetical protein
MSEYRFGKPPTGPTVVPELGLLPDWQQAQPKWIAKALERATAQPGGGWYVIDGSRSIGPTPKRHWVAGEDLIVWRDEQGLLVAPDRCPHMGASLEGGQTGDGCVICPWHGLALGRETQGAWQPYLTHDDGVLVWVQLPGEEPTESPIICERPTRFVDGVVRVEANCDPEDVLANRLDPWHGAHYHPHSFGQLKVLDRDDETVTVRVVFRATKRMGVEVDARFHCPDPRTIVMTIIDGEGAGSVVETHATPLRDGSSAIVEATLASSNRPGFRMAALALGMVRKRIEVAAERLWLEDAAYAERRYALRTGRI